MSSSSSCTRSEYSSPPPSCPKVRPHDERAVLVWRPLALGHRLLGQGGRARGLRGSAQEDSTLGILRSTTLELRIYIVMNDIMLLLIFLPSEITWRNISGFSVEFPDCRLPCMVTSLSEGHCTCTVLHKLSMLITCCFYQQYVHLAMDKRVSVLCLVCRPMSTQKTLHLAELTVNMNHALLRERS